MKCTNYQLKKESVEEVFDMEGSYDDFAIRYARKVYEDEMNRDMVIDCVNIMYDKEVNCGS